MVHARLAPLGSLSSYRIAYGAMYHIVKFYVATWDAIRMWALECFVGSYVLCPLASYVIARPSLLSVSSWKFDWNCDLSLLRPVVSGSL